MPKSIGSAETSSALVLLCKHPQVAKSRLLGVLSSETVEDMLLEYLYHMRAIARRLRMRFVVVTPDLDWIERRDGQDTVLLIDDGRGFWPAVRQAIEWLVASGIGWAGIGAADLLLLELADVEALMERRGAERVIVAATTDGGVNYLLGPTQLLSNLETHYPSLTEVESIRRVVEEHGLEFEALESIPWIHDIDTVSDLAVASRYLRLRDSQTSVRRFVDESIKDVRRTPHGRVVFLPTMSLWKRLIAVLPIDELRFQNAWSQEKASMIEADLLDTQVLRDPVAVDGRTGLIVDGQHRVTALRSLGIERVPCQIVDYRSPQVTIGNWIRQVRGIRMDRLLADLASKGCVIEPATQDGRIIISCGAELVSVGESNVPLSANYQLMAMLETRIASMGGSIVLHRDDLGREGFPGCDIAILPPEPCGKEESLRCALEGECWPSNPNRTVVTNRILNLALPIGLLGRSAIDMMRELYESVLPGVALCPYPDNALIGSRRYEEPCLVAEPARILWS